MQNYQQTPNPVEKRTFKKKVSLEKSLLNIDFFFFWQLRENNDSLRFSLKKLKGILLLLFSFVHGFQIYLQFKGDHEINI